MKEKINEELLLTLRRGFLLHYPSGAVNNSTCSWAPFSFLEVELIKIAWPRTLVRAAGSPPSQLPEAPTWAHNNLSSVSGDTGLPSGLGMTHG